MWNYGLNVICYEETDHLLFFFTTGATLVVCVPSHVPSGVIVCVRDLRRKGKMELREAQKTLTFGWSILYMGQP